MSAEGKCSVPPDEHWTKQEIFVWERVCVGKVANFNKDSGYGGDLDAKRPEGLPESRVLTSAFLGTILLQDKYRRTLTRRGVRIVGARFEETIDLANAELGHEVWLDRSLLEQGANLSGLRSTHLITFDGSKVIGTLNMERLKVDESLLMRDNAEFADVDIRGAHVGGQLDLRGSKFTGKVNMNGLHVDKDLLMGGGAEFAELYIVSAHVGGQIDLSGSKVTGTLNMNGLRVDESLFMRDKAGFAHVDLVGAHVGGTLELNGSKVTGKLNMNGLQVGQHLFMRDKTEFAEVDLGSAHVGGQLDLSGSKVKGTLDMNGLQVGQSLLMGDKAEFAEVDLGHAHVSGQLDLSGSPVTGEGGAKVTRKLGMNTLRVDQSLLMGNGAEFAEVELVGAHVGGQLSLIGSKVTGKLNCETMNVGNVVFLGRGAEFSGPIDFIFAKIGDLELAGGIFHEDVDITGTQIGGELRLGSSRHALAQWPGNPTLILRNATANAIQDLSDAWPDRLDLNGFTYRSLGGLNAAERDPMAERKVKWFREWLSKQEQYSPQPYEQLALVLQSQGEIEKATAIRYAGRERERDDALKRWRHGQHLPDLSRWLWLTALDVLIGYGYRPLRALGWATAIRYASRARERGEALKRWRHGQHLPDLSRWLWLTALDVLIGYGYRPWRALGWAIGFVVLGAAVLRISGEGPRHGMPIGLAYSFDMLLPIVKLREWHYHIDLAGWARYYFYGHKIMGYVFASFLIAGLSGLTKKT